MKRNDPAPSIWLVQDLPRKIAKGSIDRGAIAVAATNLLDEAGLDSFTMRDLGSRLGVSAMACYAHVRHKDDVLELAQDHIMGTLKVGNGSWEVLLRNLAEDYRDLLVGHPWLPQLAGHFLNAGPNVTSLAREAAQHLTRAGLPAEVAPSALSAVFTVAHGHGAVEAAWRGRLSDTTLDGLVNRLADRCPDDPVLARRAEHGSVAAARDDWSFAMDTLIVGIAARFTDLPPHGG